MISINEEYHRAKMVQQEVGSDFFINQKYQVEMEWMVLGSLTILLKEGKEAYPTYALKQLNPEFECFDEYKNDFCPMEITEALFPGRKRSLEYKLAKEVKDWSNIPGSIKESIPNPWESLKECLQNKSNKSYPKNTWLIIYFNISYGYISMYGQWDTTLLANAKHWKIPNGAFSRILIMNSSKNSLVELYPSLKTIKPENIMFD